MNYKHLVLGSEGQIGSYLCRAIRESYIGDVLNYDISKSPSQDLRQKSDALRYCIEESDFIYFLAFDVGGSTYLKEKDGTFDFIHNNMAIMYQTFDILKDYPGKRLIFTSSQMSNMNHSAYGRLKAVGESYTLAYGGLVTKFWNVFGWEQDLQKSHVITDFIRSAIKTGKITMKTYGEESRQFLYADTACLALIELMCTSAYENISVRDGLHITNFQWNTIFEIAQMIAESAEKQTNKPVEIIRGDLIDTIQNNIRNEPDMYIKTVTNEWYRPELLNIKFGIDLLVEHEIRTSR